MKKLITVVLVLVMLVSILALPAAAAAEARYPAYLCPDCGGTTTRVTAAGANRWLYRCDSCQYEFYR